MQAELEASERRLEIMVALSKQRSQQPLEIRSRKKSGSGEATRVALASDWHPEEVVTLAATNGLNEHNLEIADRKIWAYFEHVVKLIQHSRQGSEIRTMVLALLGDFMSGHIHEDLVEITSLSPTETILWVQQRIAAGIRYVLENANLDRLVIPCCIGNHGRTTNEMRITTAIKHSYEWLMYQQLRMPFDGVREVTFESAQTPFSKKFFANQKDPRLIELDTVDLQQKTDALAACTLLCLPSTQESFGGVFTEAWMMGKPVIGTDIPAISEVIDNEVNGYLIQPKAEIIADRICHLLANPALAQQMGQTGQTKTIQQYSWEKLAQKTEAIYTKVLQGV